MTQKTDRNTFQEHVVLVDESDTATGVMEKMAAHDGPHLHRAFSVFIFNSAGEMLLQQRAASKYHSPLLWTNACCSHPRQGESVMQAATRRLAEEMGMACELKELYTFIYMAEVGNGLTENELDHVLAGTTDATPTINTDEVEDYKYLSISKIKQQIAQHPERFTEWFKITFDELCRHLNQ